MTIEFILIGVSLIVVFSLIAIRKNSLFYAKVETHAILEKTDNKISRSINWFKSFSWNSYRDVVELIKDLPHIVLIFMSKFFYVLHKKTKKLVDLIKGNKIKTDGGSVSLYLKKIEKEK